MFDKSISMLCEKDFLKYQNWAIKNFDKYIKKHFTLNNLRITPLNYFETGGININLDFYHNYDFTLYQHLIVDIEQRFEEATFYWKNNAYYKYDYKGVYFKFRVESDTSWRYEYMSINSYESFNIKILKLLKFIDNCFYKFYEKYLKDNYKEVKFHC